MKIALCLSGNVGGIAGKNQAGKAVDYTVCRDLFFKNIIVPNDCDVFLHSWSVEHEEGLVAAYKPMASKIEYQIAFKGNSHEPIFRMSSKWHSIGESYKLAKQHGQYDLIMLTRFDLMALAPFPLISLAKRKRLYFANLAIDRKLPRWQIPKNHVNVSLTRKWLHDMYFIASPELLDKFILSNPRHWPENGSPNPHKAIWHRIHKTICDPRRIVAFYGWRGLDFDLYRWRVCHSLQ